jgi:two-component system chemotaxis sensor kinase CheA
MTFGGDQMKELREIFKTEAINHIKTVAKVLIRLADEGTDDAIKDLGQAYAAAHGLKGSASTIGLIRASALSGKLEEALHIVTKEQRRLSFDDVDLLLEGLDAVRHAVDDLTSDATDVVTLSPREEAVIERLGTFINSGQSRSSMMNEQKVNENRTSFIERPSRSNTSEIKASAAPRRASISPARPPSAIPESAPQKPAREMDIPQDQLQYLVSVFHAEAAEHIKALAETLFNLEEGKSDVSQLLVNAFRQAHSLKGSAGTIGFDRVATVTHALEDALGALQKNQQKISTDIVDVLLDTLDVIRRAVKDSQIGDAELTAKETNAAAQCRKVAQDILTASSKETAPLPITAKTSNPASRVDRMPLPSLPPDKESDQKLQSVPPAAPVNLQTQTKDEFIRVSEESIENLIGHVGEMFEAHLHLMSVTSDLVRLESSTENLLRLVQKWISDNISVGAGGDRDKILDSLKALRAQVGLVSKRFLHDEREFSKLIQNSQDALQKIRLAPVSTIFVMIRRQVREICRVTNKRVELFLDGGEYAVDRKVLEAIEDPLIHLIRNAVDHGMEDAEGRTLAGKPDRGKLSVVARHVGDAVELIVSDDGRGIDPEKVRETIRKRKLVKESEINNLTKDQLFDFLFESGFSTTQDVSKISGRGVGLDVVKFTMERLGGEVRISSRLGKGTSFSLRLPLSMSTLRCLLVRVSGRVMAIPASNVDKVILQNSAEVQRVGGGEVVIYNNQNIALSKLGDLLHMPPGNKKKTPQRMIVIVSFGERRVAFDVDDIVEYAQLILRPLGDLLERVSYVSGVSLLGTGEVALVLNPSDLVRATGQKMVPRNIEPAAKEKKNGAIILIVDDSMTTRTLEKTILEGAGYTVLTASDGYQALDVIGSKKCDLVVTDIQMPNMDGLTLTRNIKTQYRYLQLPVILVSSMGSDEDKAKGLESGADAYIVKMDLSQRELVETIEQLL